MSKTRVGRNPFDKKPNLAQPVGQPEKAPGTTKVLKTSNKKKEASASAPVAASIAAPAEQIIGELIDLPEENWQPLTAVPSRFLKQILARWI